MARLVLVRIAAPLFQQLITIGDWQTQRCVEGLPEGAEFLSSHFDIRTQCVVLTFQHESFMDVEPGSTIPYLGITMEDRYEWDPAWVEKYRRLVGETHE